MRSRALRKLLTLTTPALLLQLAVNVLASPAAKSLEIQDEETMNRASAAADSTEPVHIEGNVVAPEKVFAPLPQYPAAAVKSRIEGPVTVQAIIDKLGNVSSVTILKGLTPDFNKSAADTILQWKFKPATLDGEPVSVYYNLTVSFDPGPLAVGGDVQAPEVVHGPQPGYTKMAREAKVQGVVILRAVIDQQGNVTDVKLRKGLPFGLEEKAIETVWKWKFKPATLNGEPVSVFYDVRLNFRLQD